jgi:hypothetical protein
MAPPLAWLASVVTELSVITNWLPALIWMLPVLPGPVLLGKRKRHRDGDDCPAPGNIAAGICVRLLPIERLKMPPGRPSLRSITIWSVCSGDLSRMSAIRCSVVQHGAVQS